MLWYQFRWAMRSTFGGRMLRLFDRGDMEEPRLVADLQAVGAEVVEIDPQASLVAGRDVQFRHVWHGGHLAQSIDGRACNVPGIDVPKDEVIALEFKTAKDSTWSKLAANGVAVEQPHYFTQCQLAMEGQGLRFCLFMSTNKDTEELYVELVQFDQKHAEGALARGRGIVDCPVPPRKISESPSFYKCKWCDVAELCHFGKAPEVNCRTCAHATPVQSGELGDWRCERAPDQGPIPEDVMASGCECHVFLPQLLRVEPLDAAQDGSWVDYPHPLGDGSRLRNGRGGLSSAEVSNILDNPNG